MKEPCKRHKKYFEVEQVATHQCSHCGWWIQTMVDIMINRTGKEDYVRKVKYNGTSTNS